MSVCVNEWMGVHMWARAKARVRVCVYCGECLVFCVLEAYIFLISFMSVHTNPCVGM